MKIIWSYGGGTQSIAMAVLIAQGRLPKPDRIVIADTGYEFRATWDYTEQYVQPMLASAGLRVEVAPHSLSKVDLYSHKGELLIPAYDAQSGSKLPTFCSSEWKTLVVRRYIGGYEANKDGVVMWIGMSLDEMGRLKASRLDWCRNHWPLCFDVKMTRAECRDLVLRAGLPLPIKSRCKMCPHQQDDEWLEVANEPEEWAEAVRIDEQIYASHGVRLHRSLLPLAEVTLTPRGKDTADPLFDCQSGFCWT